VTVWLVGAGPGDPGLITARGLDLLRGCDAVVHDRLVSAELVAEAPAGALVIDRDGMRQEELNRLLVELGRQGLEVVRLKGGDPFVYGRGGEEAIALAEAGIPFDVVPGVSSLAAVPAAAGIPLTHRGVSARVRVLSGRTAGSAAEAETVVAFMALEAIEGLRAQLLADGYDPATPAAVIARGTLPDQEVVVSQLGRLAEAAADVEGPALVVVGEVVALRERIASLLQVAV
jgi:uroporphyrin-III C-methyltransferase